MKSTPTGWPRISSAVFYDDAASAIDWLCKVFGFECRERVEDEDGQIVHSEVVYGEGLIMVGQSGGSRPGQAQMISPRSADGGNTQLLGIFVDEVDAHCEQARAAGATIFREPETNDYGEGYFTDRSYGAIDPEGHMWFFMQRVRDSKTTG